MYTKIFSQIYDGTLCTNGPWQALVTFQQLLVLSDKDGVVDMTPSAISRRTTIPLAIIEQGIAALLLPDQESRTPAEDGKRIMPLVDGRSWGWRVVNYKHYAAIRDQEDRREYQQQYYSKRRTQQLSTDVNTSQHFQHDSTNSIASTDAVVVAVADEVTALSGKHDVPLLKKSKQAANGHTQHAVEILFYLNIKASRAYRPTESNIRLIAGRLREGATLDDCKNVIDRKCSQWLADPKMSEFLRPATLFNATKFGQYQGEAESATSPWKDLE